MRYLAALLPLLFLLGCATTPSDTPPPQLPPGYYVLDAKDWFYTGLTQVTWNGTAYTVQCLEKREHAFQLSLSRSGKVKLGKSAVNLGKIRRTLSGEGTVVRPGHLTGKGRIWTKSIAGFSRDHRKGPWTLQPASAEQAERARRKAASR